MNFVWNFVVVVVVFVRLDWIGLDWFILRFL